MSIYFSVCIFLSVGLIFTSLLVTVYPGLSVKLFYLVEPRLSVRKAQLELWPVTIIHTEQKLFIQF